jgi:hypothetical protein
MSVHQRHKEPVDRGFGFNQKCCRLTRVEPSPPCDAGQLAYERLPKSHKGLNRLGQRSPRSRRPLAVLRSRGGRLVELAPRRLRALFGQVLEERCEQAVAPFAELGSLGVGQSRQPRRRCAAASWLCLPVYPRHPLSGRTEAGQWGPADPRPWYEALDNCPREAPVPARRHECGDAPMVCPAPQGRRRDPQEPTRLT